VTAMERILELLDRVEAAHVKVSSGPYVLGRHLGKRLLAKQIRDILRDGECTNTGNTDLK
jgi:hypothetical protein